MDAIAPLLEWLSNSALARVMTSSAGAREAAAAGHFVGAMVAIGASLPLSLRLIGLWASVPIADLRRVLVPISFTGFVLAFASGIALVAERPFAAIGLPAMQAKLALIGLLAVNAVALRFVPAWRLLDQVDSRGTISRFRTAGVVSIAAWAGILTLSRWRDFL